MATCRSLWESGGLQDFPEGLFGCASVTFFFLRGTWGTFCSFLTHLQMGVQSGVGVVSRLFVFCFEILLEVIELARGGVLAPRASVPVLLWRNATF